MKTLLGGKLIFVIIALAGLLVGAGAAYFVLPIVSPPVSAAAANSGTGSHGASASSRSASPPTSRAESSHSKFAVAEPGVMYPMKERVMNLAEGSSGQYIKVELALEFDVPDAKALKGEALKKRQDEFVKELAGRRPIFDDILTTVISSKTGEAIARGDGKEKLRQELKTKLGEVAGEHRLVNVYFTQLIIQ